MKFFDRFFNKPVEIPAVTEAGQREGSRPEFRGFSLENFSEAAKIANAVTSDSEEWIKAVYQEETLPVRIGNSGLYFLHSKYSEILLAVGDGNIDLFWQKCEGLLEVVRRIANLKIYSAEKLRDKLIEILKHKNTEKYLGIQQGSVPIEIYENLESIQGWIDAIASNFVGIERSGGTENDRIYKHPGNPYEAESDSGASDNGKSREVFALPAIAGYAKNRLLLSVLGGDAEVGSAMKKNLLNLVNNSPQGSLQLLRGKQDLLFSQLSFHASPGQNRTHAGYIDTLTTCVKHPGVFCPKFAENNIEFYFIARGGQTEGKWNISKGVA